MRVIQFEGTPDEFSTIEHLFRNPSIPNHDDSSDVTKDSPSSIEPKEAIRCMLTRRPVSKGQQAVFTALAEGKLEYEELLRRTGISSGSMAGVMGALGRRISNTSEIRQAGLKGNTTAIMEYDKGYLSLTKDALEVLREEGLI